MPLNTAYRPQSLDEMIGNEPGIESLRTKLKSPDPPRSFFITGPPGCGKTTIAYVLKGELSISDFDFHEYDTANTRGIDTIREIKSNVNKAPMEGSRKLYLLDECHQVTGAAAEALLKLLEDPPKHCIIVLCTSEPEKIKTNTLKAIRRRCFELDMEPLTMGKIKRFIKEVAEAEGFDDYPDAILNKISSNCWGSPGQALSILDSVIDMQDEEQILEAIENLVVSEASVKDLIQTLTDMRISSETKWNQVREMLPKIKGEPESVRMAISEWLNKLILGKGFDMNLLEMASCFTDSFMYTGRLGLTCACALACQVGNKGDDIPF